MTPATLLCANSGRRFIEWVQQVVYLEDILGRGAGEILIELKSLTSPRKGRITLYPRRETCLELSISKFGINA